MTLGDLHDEIHEVTALIDVMEDERAQLADQVRLLEARLEELKAASTFFHAPLPAAADC